MKVSESQIRAWINEYKNEGYYVAASNPSCYTTSNKQGVSKTC